MKNQMKNQKVVSILPEARKTKRMRARYNMLKAGYEKLNKRKSQRAGRGDTTFARYWRRFVTDQEGSAEG